MRWRVLIALAILGIITAGGLYARHSTADLCSRLEGQLAPLAETGTVPGRQALEDALAAWEEDLPLLSSLLHHQRLEEVGLGLSRALGYLQAGDTGGCRAQLRGVLYLLDDIGEYDRVTWKTLF